MALQVEQLITDHLDLWTQAQTAKSTSGRGSNNKIELTGIKKLRELILELAVRGKLVPQDPNDEPASELLKRIAAEKEALIKAGKLKKQKPLPPISEEVMPFELPEGWIWSQLDDIGYTSIGLTYSPNDVGNSGTPVLRSSNIQNGKIDLNDLVRVSKKIPESLIVELGDLLICARNGSKALVGKTAMIRELSEEMTFGAFMAIFRSKLNPYIEVFLNSPVFRGLLEGVDTTTINQITQNNLKSTLLPIPPQEEQTKIVAKVDELMALCDQLEQQSCQQLDAHNELVDALLATLTQSQNADELASNWQRLAAHFDTLFTTEYSIDALKQTILQLAVMGKLVKQDPNDEPASELLKRIAAEKDALVKAGKIKKQKPLPPINDDEKPFELPDGWEWVHLLDISEEIGTGPFGSMIHKSDYISGGIPLINPSHMINDRIVEDKDISVNQTKLSELASYKLLSGDIVLARRGEVGRMAIVGERESGWLCGTGSFYLRLNKEISREFMALVFRVKSTREYLTGNAVGTTMVNLNHGILNSLPIGLPSSTVQIKIVSRVYELMKLCDVLAYKLNTANHLQAVLAEALVEQVVA